MKITFTRADRDKVCSLCCKPYRVNLLVKQSVRAFSVIKISTNLIGKCSKRFLADFRALSRNDREAVVAAMELFDADRFHRSLGEHVLEGRMKGLRAIAADDDMRIIFREHSNGDEVTMIAVGSHQKVYRR